MSLYLIELYVGLFVECLICYYDVSYFGGYCYSGVLYGCICGVIVVVDFGEECQFVDVGCMCYGDFGVGVYCECGQFVDIGWVQVCIG